jgi:uncharacterized protein (DUF1697 family)
MKTYIAILRGINVSGHNIIKMDALKALFEKLGFQQVKTYVQSGNIVFKGNEENADALANKISSRIKKEIGYDVPVIVLTSDTLRQITAENPFPGQPGKDDSYFHVTFLSEKPTQADIEAIQAKKQGEEELAFTGRAVYLYCPLGYGKSKLTNNLIEAKLKVGATTRNWRTTLKLLEMAESLGHRAQGVGRRA